MVLCVEGTSRPCFKKQRGREGSKCRWVRVRKHVTSWVRDLVVTVMAFARTCPLQHKYGVVSPAMRVVQFDRSVKNAGFIDSP
jgi:hypothetical protein